MESVVFESVSFLDPHKILLRSVSIDDTPSFRLDVVSRVLTRAVLSLGEIELYHGGDLTQRFYGVQVPGTLY
jgi:hypothetical protein